MEQLLKALKIGAMWGIAGATIQLALGTLKVSEFALSIKTVAIASLTFPALLSAIILRGLSPLMAEGLLAGNPLVLMFHLLLSVNIGLFIGVMCYLLLFADKLGGFGSSKSEFTELSGVS